MIAADLAGLGRLSPFEVKNRLVALATSHADRMMLNAGRGNPNFLAAEPRHGFFRLGLFAMDEAARAATDLPDGVAGLPAAEGIAARFARFLAAQDKAAGAAFLTAALRRGCALLGCSADALVHELVQGILGCQYPEPVRMLKLTESIVAHYLSRAVAGGHLPRSGVELFAVEGATAGISYLFHTLARNRLLLPGDTIAIGTPIFTPYLEIPRLAEYRLLELAIAGDPAAGWQYPAGEIDKLRDPRVKALLLVNPGNPASVKIADPVLAQICDIIAGDRPDLIIITDDVYATFADDFVSLFALCPRNTILLYSFSKYFGATGWRLGIVAAHAANVIDEKIAALSEEELQALDARYGSLVMDPRALKFIDRLAADSRAVALNHTAGLSTPQQVQMALFALFELIDDDHAYQDAMKRLIHTRHQALFEALGVAPPRDPNAVDYYALLDLEILGAERFGQGFVDWLLAHKNPLEILLRLADESGVVLLPGRGFATPHPSARVSLANLSAAEYARLGSIIRSAMEGYAEEYRAAPTAAGDGR